jgi:hypothetical protein
MIFLIQYNRPTGQIETFKVFDDKDRAAADDARLDLELELHRRNIEHEVVLLEAPNEQALRRTHRRYFEDPSEILNSAHRLTG